MDLTDKKALKEAWVTALTDGSHMQGKKTLFNSTHHTFCCLGVAAHVWGLCSLDAMAAEYEYEDSGHIWEGPSRVYEELKDLIGGAAVDHLVDMNDKGHSFEEIAKVISETWRVQNPVELEH